MDAVKLSPALTAHIHGWRPGPVWLDSWLHAELVYIEMVTHLSTTPAHRTVTKYQTVNDGVAHSKNPRKCTYHVTFDLDLEHSLDARLPGDHRVQVWWRSGHLRARRSDLHKSLQTDRWRTPHNCISSCLEWANNDICSTITTKPNHNHRMQFKVTWVKYVQFRSYMQAYNMPILFVCIFSRTQIFYKS